MKFCDLETDDGNGNDQGDRTTNRTTGTTVTAHRTFRESAHPSCSQPEPQPPVARSGAGRIRTLSAPHTVNCAPGPPPRVHGRLRQHGLASVAPGAVRRPSQCKVGPARQMEKTTPAREKAAREPTSAPERVMARDWRDDMHRTMRRYIALSCHARCGNGLVLCFLLRQRPRQDSPTYLALCGHIVGASPVP